MNKDECWGCLGWGDEIGSLSFTIARGVVGRLHKLTSTSDSLVF